MPLPQKLHRRDVAASAFGQKTLTVTAEFSRVILHNRVGAVVSDDVVGAVAKKLHASRLGKFAGFLIHHIRSEMSGHCAASTVP